MPVGDAPGPGIFVVQSVLRLLDLQRFLRMSRLRSSCVHRRAYRLEFGRGPRLGDRDVELRRIRNSATVITSMYFSASLAVTFAGR